MISCLLITLKCMTQKFKTCDIILRIDSDTDTLECVHRNCASKRASRAHVVGLKRRWRAYCVARARKYEYDSGVHILRSFSICHWMIVCSNWRTYVIDYLTRAISKYFYIGTSRVRTVHVPAGFCLCQYEHLFCIFRVSFFPLITCGGIGNRTDAIRAVDCFLFLRR